jgi:hypothetical protein
MAKGHADGDLVFESSQELADAKEAARGRIAVAKPRA